MLSTIDHDRTAEAGSGVTNESEPTLPSFSRLGLADLAGHPGSHRVTNPVASLRQLGAVRRAVIIVNELAPGARDAKWKQLFRSTLGEQVQLIETRVRHFEGAVAAARGAAAWGAELVIAVGGDGTVNAIVNGLGDSGTRLAVVPAGTANDLAHLVGQHGVPTEDALAMASWERKDIDAIDVNGTRFYSAGGLGWVADVAHRANRWRSGGPIRRWLLAGLGHFIYTLACVAVIFGKQRLGAKTVIKYTDAADGQEKVRELDAYGVMVASSKKVGKSFELAPVSEMDDGRFELILFPRVQRRRLLKTVLWAQRGKLFEIPEIEYIQVTRASIQCDRRVRFFGDGEILEHGETFEVGIAATPVRIMAPGLAEPVASLGAALQRA